MVEKRGNIKTLSLNELIADSFKHIFFPSTAPKKKKNIFSIETYLHFPVYTVKSGKRNFLSI